MSWSFSQTGPVKEVKDAFKDANEANPLAEPEAKLRQKAEGCLSEIESKCGREFVVAFSGNGSQTIVDGDVTSVSLSINITTPPA